MIIKAEVKCREKYCKHKMKIRIGISDEELRNLLLLEKEIENNSIEVDPSIRPFIHRYPILNSGLFCCPTCHDWVTIEGPYYLEYKEVFNGDVLSCAAHYIFDKPKCPKCSSDNLKYIYDGTHRDCKCPVCGSDNMLVRFL